MKMLNGYLRWFWYLLFPVALITAVFTVSCSEPALNCDYTEFVLKEEDAHLSESGHDLFSFEYPRCLHLISTPGRHDWQTTRLSFTKKGIGRFSDWYFYRLHIRVYPAGVEGNTDALTAIESDISDFSTSQYIQDFQVFERSTITIDGITGEYVHYSYRDPPPQETNPYEQIVKEVWFDYDGFVWQIYFIYGPEYDEEDTEEVGTYFDHIIETFRILD